MTVSSHPQTKFSSTFVSCSYLFLLYFILLKSVNNSIIEPLENIKFFSIPIQYMIALAEAKDKKLSTQPTVLSTAGFSPVRLKMFLLISSYVIPLSAHSNGFKNSFFKCFRVLYFSDRTQNGPVLKNFQRRYLSSFWIRSFLSFSEPT